MEGRTEQAASGLSHFVSHNRKALLIGAAGMTAVAASAAGYYYYSSPGAGLSPSSATVSAEKPSASDKKKGKKSKKSKKAKESSTGGGPASETSSVAGDAGVAPSGKEAEGSSKAKVEEEKGPAADGLAATTEQIQAMSEQERHKMSVDLKTQGNKAYSNKKYNQAVTLYSKAIEFEEQAVFYSNRAACYTNLSMPDKVIEDCTQALRLDRTYIKALNRRAAVKEQKGDEASLYEALCDYTAAAILGQFSNQQASESVDRLMKRLSAEQAQNILKEREPRLPSATFMKAYLEAFRKQPSIELPENASQGDKTLRLAFEATDAGNYAHAVTLTEEAIQQGLSTPQLEGRAYNHRGTFKFVMADAPGALADLDKSTDLYRDFTQTWVRKASVHMELGQASEANKDFEIASEVNPNDPDIYYHRGQVMFIMGQFQEAIEQYKKSTELDDSFIFSQIQHAVALYKDNRKEKAEAKFKKLLKNFSESPEVYNYHGELFLDQANSDPSYYAKAIERFDQAVEWDKKRHDGKITNVLPLINKALCVFQSDREALDRAESICNEALAIDPECDIGVATLAQLYLQQNKIHKAAEMFERSAQLARTEPELIAGLTYLNATKAQITFVETYPAESVQFGVMPGQQ